MPDTYGADGATALCCLVAVLLGALVVVLMVRRRKPMPAAPPATPTPPAPAEVPPGSHEPWAAVPTADLQRQADSRLIEADNASAKTASMSEILGDDANFPDGPVSSRQWQLDGRRAIRLETDWGLEALQ